MRLPVVATLSVLAATFSPAQDARDEKPAIAQRLEAITADYDKALREADAAALKSLHKIAQELVAAQEFEQATKVYREILHIQPSNLKAVEFFVAMKRDDVVEEARKAISGPEVPKRRKLFVTESGRTYQRLPNGKWRDSHPKTLGWLVEYSRSDFFIALKDIDGTRHLLGPDCCFWARKDEHDSNGFCIWRRNESGVWKR